MSDLGFKTGQTSERQARQMDHQPWDFLNLVFFSEAKTLLQMKVPARIGQFMGKSKEAEKQEFKGLGRGTGSWHWQGHSGLCLLTVAPQGCRHSVTRFSMFAVEARNLTCCPSYKG